MNQYYPNNSQSKRKNLIKRIIKTDNKLYKTGAALAHLYTAMAVINGIRGGRK